MEFLHAIFEWVYEGNPEHLTITYVVSIAALIGFCIFILGYLIGILHYQRIVKKREKARRRHKELQERVRTVESAKTATPVEIDDSSERVDDPKSVKKQSAKKQPQFEMPFPPSQMIRRVHKAIDTHETIRRLDETYTEAWEEPWDKEIERFSDIE